MNRQIVWAKIRYCPYWPSKIIKYPPPEIGAPPSGTECVYFFGSKNYGFPRTENVLDYFEHRSKYIKKGRGQMFESAVKECDAEANNSPADKSFIDDRHEIVVKKELEFNVKVETNTDAMYSTEVHKMVHVKCEDCRKIQVDINDLNVELQNVTKNLLSTKKEHQQTHLMVQQKDRDIRKLQLQLKTYEQQIAEFSQKITQLNDEICVLKKVSNQKKRSSKSNDLYEVEKILNHKQKLGAFLFLVHWTGYDESHDSWVAEKDLCCRSLLAKYKKSNSLK